MNRYLNFTPIAVSVMFFASNAHAFFLDGDGHYGLLTETRIAPDFQHDNGTYQATRVHFDLNGEVRANDRASFNLRLGLSEDPSSLYLGDAAKPKACEPRHTSASTDSTTDSSCEGRSQSSVDPGTSNFKPVIREAYGKYAFNFCILTAGRRSRDVGLGAMIDSGKKSFDTDASIFDGVSCDVNMQKHQDIGFTFGVDKLQETGAWIDNPYDRVIIDTAATSDYDKRRNPFGPNGNSDDIEQIFFGIKYDDLKSKAPGAFSKQIDIYFANILANDSKTDIKLFDFYTGFYFGKFALKNELVFRLGKSADPALTTMGGKRLGVEGEPATNSVNSVGLAGTLEYTVTKSGAALGPEEFNEGNLKRHVVFSDYAYAPGDSDGYYVDRASESTANNEAYGETRRNTKAKALAFHRNYHPALLFFNGRQTSRKYAVGGVFDPERVMNTALYSLGYRYENMENGNIEVKVITGRLLEGAPQDVIAYLNASSSKSRPIGFYGTDLGYEFDAKYSYHYQKEVELGLGLAAAIPGKAWKTSSSSLPSMGYGLMGSFAIKF